ncbi:hypothetical protein [Aliiroseovarius sp.]|uniref:hypothetical protein n=1 Tax=Aliiroseovarius sp. TaxID=1872442 RepID=UPI003BACEBE8
MEYGRLQPIKGVSGRESTAFTKRTIKELLEEEAAAMVAGEDPTVAPTDLPEEPSSEPVRPTAPPAADPEKTQSPSALASSWLRQPPHLQDTGQDSSSDRPKDYAPKADAVQPEAAPSEKPKSFLRRLIGG